METKSQQQKQTGSKSASNNNNKSTKTPQKSTQLDPKPRENILNKQKQQKRVLWKNIYESPFRITLTPVSPETSQLIYGRLSSGLKTLPPRPTRGGKKLKKKLNQSKNSDSQVEIDVEAQRGQKRQHEVTPTELLPSKQPKGSETDTPVTKNTSISDSSDLKDSKAQAEVVVGLNAVTRALEKNSLRLVVVCRSIQPSRLIQHIPILCNLKGVPLSILPESPESMAALLGETGIRTAICIGFRKTSSPSPIWDPIVDFITSKTEPVDIPWIPDSVVETLKETGGTTVAASGTPQASKLTKIKYSGTILQPLRIKKVQHTAPAGYLKKQQQQPKTKAPSQ